MTKPTPADEQPTVTLDAIAREIAEQYGRDLAETRAAVDVYTDQISDDSALYDYSRNALTELGADVMRRQFADDEQQRS